MTVECTPRRLRKYAMEAPMTPPPHITTRMWSPQTVTTGAHAFVRGFDPHLGEVWTFGGSAFHQSALRPALVWERIGSRYVSGRTGGMPESEGSGLASERNALFLRS